MGITIEEVLAALSQMDNDIIKYYLECCGASQNTKKETAELMLKLSTTLRNANRK